MSFKRPGWTRQRMETPGWSRQRMETPGWSRERMETPDWSRQFGLQEVTEDNDVYSGKAHMVMTQRTTWWSPCRHCSHCSSPQQFQGPPWWLYSAGRREGGKKPKTSTELSTWLWNVLSGLISIVNPLHLRANDCCCTEESSGLRGSILHPRHKWPVLGSCWVRAGT